MFSLKLITFLLGYQQVTSLSASAGLTPPAVEVGGMAKKPTIAIIIPEGQAVRWRDDGVAPTASVGMPLAVGETLQYDGDLNKIKFIEVTAGAKLNVSYYA